MRHFMIIAFCFVLSALVIVDKLTPRINPPPDTTVNVYYTEDHIEHVHYVETDVISLLKKLYGDKWTTAYAIMMAESHGRSDAIGDKHLAYTVDGQVYGISVGVMQVRLFSDRPPMEMLLDVYFNIVWSYYNIYLKQGFKAWGAYTNGSYKQFLPVLKPDNKKKTVKEVSI